MQQPMPGMTPNLMQPHQPMMRTPGADDSGVLVVPPSPPQGMQRPLTPFGATPAEVTEKTRPKKKGRAPFAAAAIAAFVVAAALTAVAARGRTKTAAASPVPVPPVATQKAAP
jgi:hypothetical protein